VRFQIKKKYEGEYFANFLWYLKNHTVLKKSSLRILKAPDKVARGEAVLSSLINFEILHNIPEDQFLNSNSFVLDQLVA